MADRHPLPNATGTPAGGDSDEPRDTLDTRPAQDEELEALREILIGHYRQRAQEMQGELAVLQGQIDALDTRINDKQALIDTVTPIMASSIRQSIHDSKDEMVEALTPVMARSIQHSIEDSRDEMVTALYPIMGKLVSRSVSEAMRELAHRIDMQMRDALSPDSLTRRVKSRLLGLSDSDMAIRTLLPFSIRRIFLIHRETGLLLYAFSPSGEEEADSDVISGMLTAIRDFTQDAFGRGQEGQLDAIRYGDTSILIDTAARTYMAAVVDGVAPSDFQSQMRNVLYDIEQQQKQALRTFNGETAPFAASQRALWTLVPAEQQVDDMILHGAFVTPYEAAQGVSAAAVILLIVTALGLVLAAWWIIRGLLVMPWLTAGG